MNTLRNMILTAGLLALGGTTSACTAFTSFSEVEALNDAQAVGSPFTQALAEEYRRFANSELKDMFDYPDALHFARKGLAAASGENVLPEPVVDWNLSEEHIRELSAARGRLIVAYDLGGREVAPEIAAKAQAKYDCWIEGQEENWSDAGGTHCKDEFLKHISRLEGMIQPPPAAPAPEITADTGAFDIDPNAPMAVENAMYLVFFNWDSSDLGSGALNVLDAVADEVSKNPPTAINVVGHTDTSGPQKYNQRLAFKRANNVKDALVQRGVDPALILVDAKGETELLVETPDNIREPANRRVNISFN
ncbi:MAG: OmpA family protein [Rhodospirillales bacterium]|nr:OmpA family protein [Alphaproteobacteria bacterium]MCB9981364.1 OmpA family protein [Rhodospirillales bacterium]